MSIRNTTQERVLAFIRKNIQDRGYPPSVREIGAAVGLKSTSTVHGHLERLEKKGLIRRDPALPRAMEVIGDIRAPQGTVGIPLIGKVAAGAPITAIENVEEVFYLPDSFAGQSDCFFLTIQGDSMIEAGISDGDYVLVRKQNTARNGEIVVALVEDEATVKRIYRENNHFRLQPENSSMAPIYVDDCLVQGRVIGLFRRFR